MVGYENDHTSSLNGRKMFGHVVHCTPMVDDLLMGLHVEYHFFIYYMAGVNESLHVLV